jgi:hypothetical protein
MGFLEFALLAILIGLGVTANIVVLLFTSARIQGEQRRETNVLTRLAAIQEQRHFDTLAIKRAEMLGHVTITADTAMDYVTKILGRAMNRPIDIQHILSVKATPVPALTMNTGGGKEVILTTSADAYMDEVLTPSRRLAKGQRVETIGILPSVEQPVVDEELYQAFCRMADQYHVDITQVPRASVWHIVMLPQIRTLENRGSLA